MLMVLGALGLKVGNHVADYLRYLVSARIDGTWIGILKMLQD